MEENVILADPSNWLKDGIGLIEGINCIVNGTGERTQHGEGVRAVLHYVVTAIGRPPTNVIWYRLQQYWYEFRKHSSTRVNYDGIKCWVIIIFKIMMKESGCTV